MPENRMDEEQTERLPLLSSAARSEVLSQVKVFPLIPSLKRDVVVSAHYLARTVLESLTWLSCQRDIGVFFCSLSFIAPLTIFDKILR